MIGTENYSFAEEYKRLCECGDRNNGAKVYSKYKIVELNAT